MSNQPQQEQIQRDLEAPLLKNKDDVEIHSAIPLKHDFGDGESEMTIIDGRCNVVNKFFIFGSLLGLVFQSCSLHAGSILMLATGGSNPDLTFDAVFSFYFLRYWALVALFLPPFACTLFQKLRERNLKKRGNKALMKGNLENFLQCIRFQLGLFFGSLILQSTINFLAIAKSTPICLLMGYYTICLAVSLIALALLLVIVNQVCANVSALEIIVSYDKDDKDKE